MSATAPKRVWHPGLKRTLHFHDRHAMKKGHPIRRFHLPHALPTPKLPIDWTKNNTLVFPMDGNDQYGDCMYAAGCHADNTFTGNSGTESNFDEKVIVQDYLKLAGGDNGLDEGTLIEGWKQGLASTPSASILDALDIDPTNAQLAQVGIWLFGGILFMLDVPDAWIQSFQPSGGSVWDAPARADQNNGHGTWWNGVDTNGRYKLQTWGSYVWITPAGVATCDPSGFVVFSLRWFNAQGYAPNGLHYIDLANLWVQCGGKVLPPSPFPAPTPSPTPPPTPTPSGSGVQFVLGGQTFTIPDGIYNLSSTPSSPIITPQDVANLQKDLPQVQTLLTHLQSILSEQQK